MHQVRQQSYGSDLLLVVLSFIICLIAVLGSFHVLFHLPVEDVVSWSSVTFVSSVFFVFFFSSVFKSG